MAPAPEPAPVEEPVDDEPDLDPDLSADMGLDQVPASLRSSGAFFIVELEHARPTCRQWNFDADAQTLRSPHDAYQLAITGVEIAVTSRTTGGTTVACSTPLYAVEEDLLEVGEAPWYRDAASCETAIRTPQPIAMDFACPLDDPGQATASRKRFETLLGRGGSLFAIVGTATANRYQCKTIKVNARSRTGGILAGQLSWAAGKGEGGKGTTVLGYSYVPGAPQITFQRTTCSGSAGVEPRGNYVQLADAVYFTDADCKTAAREREARGVWIPRAGDAEDGDFNAGDQDTEGVPLIGGC